jgi:hypothetical protein
MSPVMVGPTSIVSADFNADGTQDLVIGTSDYGSSSFITFYTWAPIDVWQKCGPGVVCPGGPL